MGNVGNAAQWSPPACEDRRALAQRALACELTGELERAVVLIRRMRHPDRDAGDRAALARRPGPA